MQAADLLGRQFAGYQIEEIIGTGGMAVVYRATSVQNGQIVALKVLFPPPQAESVWERFRREAEMSRRLDHPAIIPILDFGEVEGKPFLAMPLIGGGSLTGQLQAHGKFDEGMAIDIVWQLADALHYAHTRGVIHRDVKPSNVLLTDDGRAMLADFGIARVIDDPGLTQTGLIVGTPAYIAPEQAAGEKQIDGRADLYALGVVLFQLITGRTPFQGSTPQVLYAQVYEPPPLPSSIADISPAVEAVILRALAKDPADRFQSGAEMARALPAIAETEDSSTRTRLEIPPEPPKPRQPIRRTMILLVLAVVLAGLGWGLRRFVVAPSGAVATPSVSIVAEVTTRPTSTPVPATLTPTVAPTFSPTPTVTPTSAPTPTSIIPYPVGTLLKGSRAGVFRVAADDRLQHLFDWDTFLAFGYTEPDILTIDDAVLTPLPVAGELTRVIQDESGQVYWVVDGERWSVERWAEALRSLDPSPVDATLLAELPLTFQDEDLPQGTLLTSDDVSFYYLFSDGLIRRIDQDLLPTYGLDPSQAVQILDPVLLAYRGGKPLTELIQPQGEESIYRLEGGQRQPMPTGDALWALGYGIEDISLVPAAFVEQFALISAPTCSESPADFIADLWQADVDLAIRLGCPQAAAQTTAGAWQPFEGGDILWRQDSNLIYVLPESGAWQPYGDTWEEGDLQFDPAITAPNGFYQPVRGFGKVWREKTGVRETLGWGIREEIGGTAQWQSFASGFAMALASATEGDAAIRFILFNDGTFLLSGRPTQ